MVITQASASKALAASVKILEKVGVPDPGDRIKDYPFQLSGGYAKFLISRCCEGFGAAVNISLLKRVIRCGLRVYIKMVWTNHDYCRRAMCATKIHGDILRQLFW